MGGGGGDPPCHVPKQLALKCVLGLQDSITGAQKAVEELSKKMRDLAWDVQQERVNARVIMESLLLEDKHIKRLAALPVRLLPFSKEADSLKLVEALSEALLCEGSSRKHDFLV